MDGVEAMMTNGSAVSNSSQRVWMCSMTGSKHVKRSISDNAGMGSPEPKLGDRETVSLPDSTERVDREGRWTCRREREVIF